MTTDDNDNYDIEEILLLALISAAPPAIRVMLAQTLREQVSIKAGDAAAKVMEETLKVFPNREAMFAEIKNNLHEELRGDTAKRTVDPRTAALVDTLRQLLGFEGEVEVVELGRPGPAAAAEVPDRTFVEPTPGCTCSGCTYVKSMMEKGVRIDSRTGEHIGPHHMN